TPLGVGVGALAIATGVAPTLISEPEVHGLAVLTLLGIVFAMRLLGWTAGQKELAEASVRSSARRFQSLLRNATDAVVVVDSEGRVAEMTPAIEGFTGYPVSEYLGRMGFEYVHPDDRHRGLEMYAEALQRPGGVLRAELRVRHRDGSWRWA